MIKKYYFDTSIWLDFFEERDELHFPKGKRAKILLELIVQENHEILCSDVVFLELKSLGYAFFEIEKMFRYLLPVIHIVKSTEKQKKRSRDLAAKRKIPRGDALHALIARDAKAILVTRDKDFQKLLDITIPKKPEELI